MKTALFLCFLLIALPLSALDGAFIGISPEVNGYTRTELALGGALLLGFDLGPNVAIGQKTGFYHDTNILSALEIQGFFRYKLPWLRMPNANSGPFLQAEAGCTFLIEENENFPMFSGSGSLGWRFSFGRSLYAEPVFRAGYPFIWGAGLTIGIRFAMKGGWWGVMGDDAEEEEFLPNFNR